MRFSKSLQVTQFEEKQSSHPDCKAASARTRDTPQLSFSSLLPSAGGSLADPPGFRKFISPKISDGPEDSVSPSSAQQ